MKTIILETLRESLDVKSSCIRSNLDQILRATDMLTRCFVCGSKVLIFGNGGSAADAQHISAEFVNRFQIERPPLAVLALTTDSSVLTSIGNDYNFDDIFAKQILALGCKNDIAWGISTSGNSKNVVRAIQAARQKGLTTIAFTGKGGDLATITDLVFSVASDSTPRIQEAHILLGHILCDLVDRTLYPSGCTSDPG